MLRKPNTQYPAAWAGSCFNLNCTVSAPGLLISSCRVVIKLGPRLDMGDLLPNPKEWSLAASGPDFAVWELRGT